MFYIYHPTPTQTTFGQTWAVVIDRIAYVVAQHVNRLHAIAPLLVLVHHRLIRTIFRLDRLARRWQANALPKPRPSRAGKPRPQRAPRPPDQPRIPDSPLWLVRLVQPTAQLSGQVATMLAHPDTRALVAAAPQAARLLRPLCRALGVPQPDWLRLPDRPKQPRPKPARAVTPAPDPAAPPDRPIPRNILAAARAWKKKYR